MGEQVTNELVDWFNAVDATYRGDLRELNELNFARFDAKMEQRFAESETKMEQRFGESEAKMVQRFAESDAKMERGFADLRTDLEKGLKEATRFQFVTWSALLLAIIGFWMRG